MDARSILLNQPHILKGILQCVPIDKDIQLYRKISPLWNKIGLEVQKERRTFSVYSEGVLCHLHNTVHSFKDSCIFARNKPPHIDLSSNPVIYENSNWSIPSKNAFSEYLEEEDGYGKQLCLTFFTSEYLQYKPFSCRSPGSLTRSEHFNPSSGLPFVSDVDHIFMTRGIVCNTDAPKEIQEQYAVTSITLRNIKGMTVYTCEREDSSERKLKYLGKYDFLKMLPKDEKIKCLLLFPTDIQDDTSDFKSFIKECLDRQANNIVLAGVSVLPYCCPVQLQGQSNRVTECDKVLAFCGDNVEAASVVIESLDCRQSMRKKFGRFKQITETKKDCIALMFRRTFVSDKKKDRLYQESSIFQELYPDVPLLGALGDSVLASKLHIEESFLYLQCKDSDVPLDSSYTEITEMHLDPSLIEVTTIFVVIGGGLI